ncbi:hypothetical protein EJ04DRAFT_160093 [Polyplosphaeria fusca]|uniref:Uncharacterized protein n=1 Tax=Polyplosphaeria fusca TaxID=682080 RepID=A0A9P4R1M7_9PLEO|nr:hypothetical protein EJ04DRAFT_160093 [Polyplosphaeria fusca]
MAYTRAPTTYQMTILVRVLNAEIITLFSAVGLKLKNLFKKQAKNPHLISFSYFVFFISVLASIFIQAADTYLHISASAVDLVEAYGQSSSQFTYGRGLAPWCLNRQTHGSINNPNYWSCGLWIWNISIDSGPWLLAPLN